MRPLTIALVAGLLSVGLASAASAQTAPALTFDPAPVVAGVDTEIHATFTASGNGYIVGLCRAGTDFSDLLAAGSRCTLVDTGVTSGTTVTTTVDVPYFFTPFVGGSVVRCQEVACELAVGIGTGTFPYGTVDEFVVSPVDFLAEVRGVTSARPGAEVRVFTTRFGTADLLAAVQCPVDGPFDACNVGSAVDESVASPNGTVTAQRFLEAADGSLIDCVAVACGIGLRMEGIAGTDGSPRHYLRPFRINPPVVNLIGPRDVTDVPRSVLIDAQGLSERSVDTTMHQCVEALLGDPFDPSVACADSDAPVESGATDYRGSLTVTGSVDVDGQAYSCAIEQCVAVLSSRPSSSHPDPVAWSVHGLTYRSMVYRSGGTFSGYFLSSTVRVTGRTFYEAGGDWEYGFCSGRPTLAERTDACEAFTPVPDIDGAASIETPVRSVLATAAGETRCGISACSLMVVYTPPGGEPDFFVVDIDFRRPTAELSQSQGLVDGQTVETEEIGYLSTGDGAGAWVMQCGADTSGPTVALRCANVGTVESNFAGHFVGSIDVVRSLVDANGNQVDCGENPCAIAFVSMAPDLTVLSARGFPISFAPLPAS